MKVLVIVFFLKYLYRQLSNKDEVEKNFSKLKDINNFLFSDIDKFIEKSLQNYDVKKIMF